MKKKLVFYFSMILAIMISVPVQAATYPPLSNSSFNQITLIDDAIQNKKVMNDVEKYLRVELGENYREKITRNELAVKNAKKIESLFETDRNGTITYPNYIGGLYIDQDDNLVIQLVKEAVPDSKGDYIEMFEIDADATKEYVEYSYEELNNVHDRILDYFLNNNLNNSITGLYIDVISNRVVVELKNYNEQGIKDFKNNVINLPIVSFAESRNFEEISNINPGAGFVSSFGKKCSYGYRAKTSTGQVGIVTAAHCFSGINNTIPGIGTVTKWQNSGTIDAAFVATTSGNNPTNILAKNPPFDTHNTVSTSVISSFISGQRVAKLGTVTGYTIGGILSPSYSATVNGVAHTDLVRAEMIVSGGDSGGIVIERDFTFNSNGFRTAGICTAAEENSNQMLFTKASRINSIFGLSRY